MLTLAWDSSNRPILMMRSQAGVDLKSSAEAARQTHAELLRSQFPRSGLDFFRQFLRIFEI